jgi:hypothetical protein
MSTQQTPKYCTLDGDPANGIAPYLPGVHDMGGAAYIDDDAEGGPVPEQDCMADDVNQMQKLLVRACRMIPKASFDLSLASTVVTLNGFIACNETLTIDDLIVAYYFDSCAEIHVKWLKGKLPVGNVGPSITGISSVLPSNKTYTVSQYVDATYAGFYVCAAVANTGVPDSAFRVRVDIDGEGSFTG